MIKKEYQKPTMNVVQLKTQAHLLIISNVQSNEGLKRGTSGDMGGAYSRGSSGWDDDEVDW